MVAKIPLLPPQTWVGGKMDRSRDLCGAVSPEKGASKAGCVVGAPEKDT